MGVVKTIPPYERFLSTLSNHAIPHRVAPQQSSAPVHITVDTKMIVINNFLTLSYPHLVKSYTNVVKQFHEGTDLQNCFFLFNLTKFHSGN